MFPPISVTKMQQTLIRNHDHIAWDTVRQCESVRGLSRFTPDNSGDFEPAESMLARADAVADGMRTVIQRACPNQKEDE